MVEHSEAQHHVEGFGELMLEDVGVHEAVSLALDPLCREHELGLLDEHLAPVDAEHELRPGLQGKQRPQSGVAPEVEHTPPVQRSS